MVGLALLVPVSLMEAARRQPLLVVLPQPEQTIAALLAL